MITVDIGEDLSVRVTNYPIFKLEISNVGQKENRGFGNVICRYKVQLLRYNNPTMQNVLKTEEWEVEKEVELTHNRRDGPIELTRLAIEHLYPRTTDGGDENE